MKMKEPTFGMKVRYSRLMKEMTEGALAYELGLTSINPIYDLEKSKSASEVNDNLLAGLYDLYDSYNKDENIDVLQKEVNEYVLYDVISELENRFSKNKQKVKIL